MYIQLRLRRARLDHLLGVGGATVLRVVQPNELFFLGNTEDLKMVASEEERRHHAEHPCADRDGADDVGCQDLASSSVEHPVVVFVRARHPWRVVGGDTVLLGGEEADGDEAPDAAEVMDR